MISSNPLAWRARKQVAARLLRDRSGVRDRVRHLIARVDRQLEEAAKAAAAEQADERTRVANEREALVHEQDEHNVIVDLVSDAIETPVA